jgi:hypothetical protein
LRRINGERKIAAVLRHHTTLAMALVLGLFIAPLDATAQRAKKVPRIGYLSMATADPSYQSPSRIEPP